eukprot:5534161-Pyramimonas_sp.AAC.1
MMKANWKVVGPGHFAMRDGDPLILTATPYRQVSKYFMRDISKQFIPERMDTYLGDIDNERALEILERGLLVDPPRGSWISKSPKWSKMIRRCIKQVFTRSYVTASTLHRWGYQ